MNLSTCLMRFGRHDDEGFVKCNEKEIRDHLDLLPGRTEHPLVRQWAQRGE